MSVLLAAVMSTTALGPTEFVRFSRGESLTLINETVTVGAKWNPETRKMQYTARYTWWQQTPDNIKEALIDSSTCPAIRDVLVSMRDLQMPKPAPLQFETPSPRTTDGVAYSLVAPSSYSNGQLTISSNVGSPLAAWIDRAFVALASCLPN